MAGQNVTRRHIPPAPKLAKIVGGHGTDEGLGVFIALVRKAFVKLDEWTVQVKDYYSGLPTPHAETHKGGSDNVAGTTAPTAITPGQAASVGHAVSGFAPIDHVHDTTLLASQLSVIQVQVEGVSVGVRGILDLRASPDITLTAVDTGTSIQISATNRSNAGLFAAPGGDLFPTPEGFFPIKDDPPFFQ